MNRQAARRMSDLGTALLVLVIACSACVPAMSPGGGASALSAPTSATAEHHLSAITLTSQPSYANAPPEATVAIVASTRSVKISVTSQAPRSTARVYTLTPPSTDTSSAPVASPASRETAAVGPDAEPLILIGLENGAKCGHGDVVAQDGHSMRATPRIGVHERNKLEVIGFGQRVDLIDCRLWTNTDEESWVAVRTKNGKLGWMMLQSDKFYVTIYPIPIERVPAALTGIPSGTAVAYVPPSECNPTKPTTTAVATSIGIDFVPVVGDLKGLGEAATGCDLYTGESLGNWRWLGLLGLIGLSEAMLLRHADDTARGIRLADDLEEGLRLGDEAAEAVAKNADEVAQAAGKHVDEVADVARGAAKAGETAKGVSGNAPEAAKIAGMSADEIAARLGKFEQPCSFSPDTSVMTPAGMQPIVQIRPGDRVLALEQSAGAVGYFPVTAVSAHVESDLLRIHAAGTTVLTTSDHPFLVDGVWKPAGTLHEGEHLTTPDDDPARVEAIAAESGPRVMYNLTVAAAHSYFAGSGLWLVHNACGKSLRNNLLGNGDLPEWTNEIEWQAHHVIPRQWEDLDIVQVAKKAGFNFDGAENGVPLPRRAADADFYDLPYHSGSHPDYSATIRGQLDTIAAEYEQGALSDAGVAERVWHLALTQRAAILRQMTGRLH